ncbi:MAG: hypothetical protein MUE57_03800, partial [Syntrophales bacterium]|nr:hypothetical protein [Syntrophales bacterium]
MRRYLQHAVVHGQCLRNVPFLDEQESGQLLQVANILRFQADRIFIACPRLQTLIPVFMKLPQAEMSKRVIR